MRRIWVLLAIGVAAVVGVAGCGGGENDGAGGGTSVAADTTAAEVPIEEDRASHEGAAGADDKGSGVGGAGSESGQGGGAGASGGDASPSSGGDASGGATGSGQGKKPQGGKRQGKKPQGAKKPRGESEQAEPDLAGARFAERADAICARIAADYGTGFEALSPAEQADPEVWVPKVAVPVLRRAAADIAVLSAPAGNGAAPAELGAALEAAATSLERQPGLAVSDPSKPLAGFTVLSKQLGAASCAAL